MKTIYAQEKIELEGPSIFLAGPSPRSMTVPSWRPTALNLLHYECNFEGTVLVPELKGWSSKFDYFNQVEWEWEGLENCSAIVFWVPRELPHMPAFTTNVEFGGYVRSGRAHYGRPNGSAKNDYLDWLYGKVTGKKPHVDLKNLLMDVTQQLSAKPSTPPSSFMTQAKLIEELAKDLNKL